MEKHPLTAPIPKAVPVITGHYANPLVKYGELDFLEGNITDSAKRLIDRHSNYFIILPGHPEASVKKGDIGLLCQLRIIDEFEGKAKFKIISRVKISPGRKGVLPLGFWTKWSDVKGKITPNMVVGLRAALLSLAKVDENQELTDIANDMMPLDLVNAASDRLLWGSDCLRYLQANDNPSRIALLEEIAGKEISKDSLSSLRRTIEQAELPQEVRRQVELYLNDQSGVLGPSAGVKHFVNTVVNTPFTKKSPPLPLDRNKGELVLNQSHGFAKELKKNLLDFNSTLWLQRKSGKEGWVKPLLLVGPPGVGKTSILETAASMLQRPLALLPLGGVSRVETLQGHAITYVDSREGLVLRRLIEAKTANCLLAFDEIDKVESEAVLAFIMEILDPVQNKNFRDSYIDYPVDLSNTLMIATANDTKNLPSALKDRFKIVELHGYSPQEKMIITSKYLLPTILDKFGLSTQQVTITDQALDKIITQYTMEAGLRTLSEKLETVIVRNYIGANLVIDEKMVGETLGLAYTLLNKQEHDLVVGACPVLYVTGDGMGMVGNMQTVLLKEKGANILTGSVDSMHNETLLIARNYLLTHGKELGVSKKSLNLLSQKRLHNHSDDISAKKEGSSGGVATFLTLISLLNEIILPNDLAVTGEITLDGRVLEVGGIPEKIIAAHRQGKRMVIIPHANLQDLVDLPLDVSRDVKIQGVKNLQEVYSLVFHSRQKQIGLL